MFPYVWVVIPYYQVITDRVEFYKKLTSERELTIIELCYENS